MLTSKASSTKNATPTQAVLRSNESHANSYKILVVNIQTPMLQQCTAYKVSKQALKFLRHFKSPASIENTQEAAQHTKTCSLQR